MQSIQQAAESRGYTLLVVDTHDDPKREAAVVRDLHQRRVDGVLLAPSADAHGILGYLQLQGVPVVLVDRMISAGLDAVGTENVEATSALVQHLAERGHRRVAMVSGLDGLATTQERVAGYRLGLRRSKLRYDRALVRSGGSDAELARVAVEQLLALDDPPTALIVGNNYMVIGTMRALRDAGLNVPADIALAVFDDFEWADLFAPRLTAVAQPLRKLGFEAVQLLLSRMSDPDRAPQRVQLAAQFVHRDSCGCLTS